MTDKTKETIMFWVGSVIVMLIVAFFIFVNFERMQKEGTCELICGEGYKYKIQNDECYCGKIKWYRPGKDEL